MALARMIMGPSRPWSDRYLFSSFSGFQRISTWKLPPTSKCVELSTFRNFSRIETELAKTDARKWFVKCFKCAHEFVMLWDHVVWRKDKDKNGKTIHEVAEAKIECPCCQELYDEAGRIRLVYSGKWIATQPWIKGNWVFGSVFP